MEENNLVSAPQAFGNVALDLFLMLTEPSAARDEYLARNSVEIRQGAGGVCLTVYL